MRNRSEILRILFVGDPDIKRMLDALAAYYKCSISAHLRRLIVNSYRETFNAADNAPITEVQPTEL